jgi:hypothetical protein
MAAVAAVPSGRREASRGWLRRPSQQADGGGATVFGPRPCCHRCQGTRPPSARSGVSGGELNPEPRGELPSSRLVLVYAMCASVCSGKPSTMYVRETHGRSASSTMPDQDHGQRVPTDPSAPSQCAASPTRAMPTEMRSSGGRVHSALYSHAGPRHLPVCPKLHTAACAVLCAASQDYHSLIARGGGRIHGAAARQHGAHTARSSAVAACFRSAPSSQPAQAPS